MKRTCLQLTARSKTGFGAVLGEAARHACGPLLRNGVVKYALVTTAVVMLAGCTVPVIEPECYVLPDQKQAVDSGKMKQAPDTGKLKPAADTGKLAPPVSAEKVVMCLKPVPGPVVIKRVYPDGGPEEEVAAAPNEGSVAGGGVAIAVDPDKNESSIAGGGSAGALDARSPTVIVSAIDILRARTR